MRSATVALPLTPPPDGSWPFHTSLPVSAFAANTQPRVVATYMQPSATIGVPVKSPAPPFATDENTHADCNVVTSAAEMTFSSDWLRLLPRSRPYERQSPPV